MVRQNVKPVRKTSHLRQEECAYGEIDDYYFTPFHDCVVRCCKCNNLIHSSYFAEAECPNCHWRFNKAESRDMYVEARVIQTIHKGWTHEILDILSTRNESCVLGPDLRPRRMDNVARNLTAFSVSALREMERKSVNQRVIDNLRASHPLSRL